MPDRADPSQEHAPAFDPMASLRQRFPSIDGHDPLKAALMAAGKHFSERQPWKVFDEETSTSLLLGCLSLASVVCGSLLTSGSASPSLCTWKQFAKSGGDADSESSTGADFALFIRHDEDSVRIAFFQAKKANDGTRIINLRRWKPPFPFVAPSPNPLTPVTRPAQPFRDQPRLMVERGKPGQLSTLAKHGKGAMDAARPDNAKHGIEWLTWMHYLVYLDGGPGCVPVSDLKSPLENDAPISEPHGAIPYLVPTNAPSLEDVFLEAFDRRGHPSEKRPWLDLSVSEAEKAFPYIADITTVVVGDTDAFAATFLPKNRAGDLVRPGTIDTIKIPPTPPEPERDHAHTP